MRKAEVVKNIEDGAHQIHKILVKRGLQIYHGRYGNYLGPSGGDYNNAVFPKYRIQIYGNGLTPSSKEPKIIKRGKIKR